MSEILNTITILFLTFWAIGFFAFGIGLVIHLCLLAAVITLIIRLIKEE